MCQPLKLTNHKRSVRSSVCIVDSIFPHFFNVYLYLSVCVPVYVCLCADVFASHMPVSMIACMCGGVRVYVRMHMCMSESSISATSLCSFQANQVCICVFGMIALSCCRQTPEQFTFNPLHPELLLFWSFAWATFLRFFGRHAEVCVCIPGSLQGHKRQQIFSFKPPDFAASHGMILLVIICNQLSLWSVLAWSFFPALCENHLILRFRLQNEVIVYRNCWRRDATASPTGHNEFTLLWWARHADVATSGQDSQHGTWPQELRTPARFSTLPLIPLWVLCVLWDLSLMIKWWPHANCTAHSSNMADFIHSFLWASKISNHAAATYAHGKNRLGQLWIIWLVR